MIRIIYMGTPQFAATILEKLIIEPYEIVAVVTQPDRPVGRKRELKPTPVKEVALRHHLNVLQPTNIKDEAVIQSLIQLQPDLIITAAYGQFLPEELLDYPRFKSINVHASLLPKYRGGAPIHYAIWKGDQETGISIIYMTKEMDAGDIIAQASVPIEPYHDVGDLFGILADVGADLLVKTLPDIFEDNLQTIPQDLQQVTYSPEITKEQECIDWNQTAQEIDWQVRAFRPFPSSYTVFEGQRMKIWAGHPVDRMMQSAPGTIQIEDNQHLIIICGQQTAYQVTELQPSGKRRMPTQQWLNGINIEQVNGTVLDE